MEGVGVVAVVVGVNSFTITRRVRVSPSIL